MQGASWSMAFGTWPHVAYTEQLTVRPPMRSDRGRYKRGCPDAQGYRVSVLTPWGSRNKAGRSGNSVFCRYAISKQRHPSTGGGCLPRSSSFCLRPVRYRDRS